MRKILAAVAAALTLAAGAAVPARPAEAAAARPIVRLMALGDSITYGLGSPTNTSYRGRLQRNLRATGVRLDMVGSVISGRVGIDRHNEGHPGWTSHGLLRGVPHAGRLDGWLRTARPNVVLLHIGTNDVRHGYSPATYAAGVEGILRTIRAHNPWAYVFVALPIRTRSPLLNGYQARTGRVGLGDYDRVLPGVVARAAAAGHGRVYLVDMRSIGARPEHMADTLHPHPRGYALMAEQWEAAMRARLPRAVFAR